MSIRKSSDGRMLISVCDMSQKIDIGRGVIMSSNHLNDAIEKMGADENSI